MLLPNTPPLLLIVYNLISAPLMGAILGLGLMRGGARPALRWTLALLALAYAGYYIYTLGSTLAQGFGWPVGGVAVAANSLGEAAAMAAGISLFALAGLWPRPPGAPRPRLGWGIGAVVAFALIAVASLFEEWVQGVATQFSVGFTLFLPVPVTALALAAWVYATLALNSRHAAAQSALPWAWEAGAALILLPTAGYALQLNYQHLLLAVTFLLLTGLLRPFSAQAAPVAASTAIPAPTTRNTQHATRTIHPETKQP
jgi:hypothetical protein